jgi:AcrR family transcriptional regulator
MCVSTYIAARDTMKKAITTRERILDAAFELISSKGYLGASTREIAQKAGVAEVTLFRLFKNKESLFTEVLRSFSSISPLTELLPQLKWVAYEEAVKILARRFITRLEEVRNWIRLMNTEVGFLPETMQNLYNEFMDQIFSLLTEFFDDAHTRRFIRDDLEPLYAARAFHSLVLGFFYVEGLLGVKTALVTKYADMVDVFVDIFCRGTKALD